MRFEEELARVAKDGFTATEIKEAREGILNFRRLARAQDTSLAATLATNAYLGRTFLIDQAVDESIAQVSPESALAAWRKLVAPQSFVKALAGDFKGQ